MELHYASTIDAKVEYGGVVFDFYRVGRDIVDLDDLHVTSVSKVDAALVGAFVAAVL